MYQDITSKYYSITVSLIIILTRRIIFQDKRILDEMGCCVQNNDYDPFNEVLIALSNFLNFKLYITIMDPLFNTSVFLIYILCRENCQKL